MSVPIRGTRGMFSAAEFVIAQFRNAGLTAGLVETAGTDLLRPLAQSTRCSDGAHLRTLRRAAPDPLDKWVTTPFEPTVRRLPVCPRHAPTTKGRCSHTSNRLRPDEDGGKLPVNVKFVIEGEEEVGSNNLDLFLEANKSRLTADVAVISDTSQFAPDLPAITYGCGDRGCEVTSAVRIRINTAACSEGDCQPGQRAWQAHRRTARFRRTCARTGIL